MTNNFYNLRIMSFIAAVLSPGVDSAEVDLDIVGSGTVIVNEINAECQTQCELTNANGMMTLIAKADKGWKFDGWQNNQCDAGNKLFFEPISKEIDETSRGAKTLSSADYNGDANIDLAAIGLFSKDVYILENDGAGTFEKKPLAEELDYPTSLASYDWEGDGDIDLILADFNERVIKLYLNDGNGNFTFDKNIEIEDKRPYAIAVVDYNNDNQPDIVMSSFSGKTNGDLYQLLESISNAETGVYLNNNGVFSEHLVLSDKPAFTIDVAYISEQKINVLAAEILHSEVAHYDVNNTDVSRTTVTRSDDVYGAAYGDLDGNGTLDVLAAFYKPSKLAVIYTDKNGAYSPQQIITEAEQGLTATAIADFDGDGLKDVATGEFNESLFYYFSARSFQDCQVNQGSSVALTAVFVESEETKSGGSFAIYLLIFATLIFARKKRFNAQ